MSGIGVSRMTCYHFSRRLASCAATRRQWADLSCCLHINQSLTRLNLTANEVLDEVAKRRYVTLGHPKCCLQRLSSVLLSPLQPLCCTSRALQRRATSTAGFAGQPAWNLLEMETPGSHFWFPFLVQHLILPSLLFLYDHDRWHTAGREWGTDARGGWLRTLGLEDSQECLLLERFSPSSHVCGASTSWKTVN